ncbi:unnamed protein product [Heligmosomoides polygyrus]|uniref:Integrase n=1 Tax=Heligmosomoides polygyrus TaxID=6339 RepID=A0A183GSE4_HELPZ|nr:unnamed protein product [Heligmosomoides polygyrus]
MKPARQWLGEKPFYAVSPGGSRTLIGVTKVEVKYKRFIRAGTVDLRLATERERALDGKSSTI